MLRYTLRALWSSRAVSALIAATLALGIGANTAIFSITHAVILRSLPVRDPAGLMNLRLGNFMSWGYIEASESLTYLQWRQFETRQDILAGAFAYANADFDVALSGGMREIAGAFVGPEAFRTLGVTPVLGRAIGDGGAEALISYRFWEREFGAAPDAIGRTLLVEGKPFTIAGIAPPRFFGLTVGRSADVYLPLAMEPYLRGKDSAFQNPIRYWLHIFGRLRPGVTLQDAQNRAAAMSPVTMQATLPSELPERVRPRYLQQRFIIDAAPAGISYVRSTLKLPLAILTGIVSLLLLLASFTAANLLLARAAARQKEIAVRIALGASRGQIVCQLALESFTLAFAGAAAGLAVAHFAAAFLLRVAATAADPLAVYLGLDWTVFGYTLGAAALSALLFGFAPALRGAQIAPAEALKSGITSSPGVARLRSVLLGAQVAVTVVLVTGAVLFGTTLWNLLTADRGFDSGRVLLANIDLRRTGISPEGRQAFYQRLVERFERLAWVESASASFVTPVSGRTWQFGVVADTASGPRDIHIHYNGVTTNYFATFGTPLLAGRAFAPADSAAAPAVAIVNSTFAHTAFGNASAIGRRIRLRDPDPRVLEIVGVARDAKYRSLRAGIPPTVYAPFGQDPEPPGAAAIALRSRAPLAGVLREVDGLLAREYPNLSYRLTTLRAQVGDSVARERMFATVCALFGALALALAAVGIFGVLSYSVERRRPEFGIRMTLGATPGDVVRLVYRQSFRTVSVGLLAGSLLAIWGGKFTRTLLFGVTPADPAVYAAVIAILAVIAVLATLLPALKASRREVMDSLRCE